MTEELAQQVADDTTARALECSTLAAEVKPIKKIESEEQFKRVVEIDATLNATIKFFEGHHRPNIRRWDEGHTAALGDLKRDQKDARDGIAITGPLLVAWNREQKLLREIEQRRLEQEAEDEKRRIAAIARDAGEKKLAAEIMKRPAEPVVAPPALPKTAGLHFAKHKHYEVDLEALVKAVAAGKAPLGALDYNAGFLQRQTTQLFDSTKPDKNGVKWLYPGVKIFEDESPVRKG